jgi:hypothetical protein
MPRLESIAARMAAASPGTRCLASLNQELHARQHRLALDALLQNQWLRTWQQECLARDASLRISGCTHGVSIAWHMVPRSNQMPHATQHCLARDASHQNQWLHTGQRRCLACDASLRINGCTHGGSTWHMVGASLESVAACNAASLGTGCLASEPMAAHMAAALLRSNASFRISGCTRGGSMSLGTWCLARISCCMQGSIAWHVMPRFESMAARVTAASPGIWCLARIRYCMQCSIAWHGMPRFKINGCALGSRIAWLMMPRFASMAARTAAESLGTWCLA